MLYSNLLLQTNNYSIFEAHPHNTVLLSRSHDNKRKYGEDNIANVNEVNNS